MEHSFNVNIAKELGVNEAILIHNLFFWIKKNEANRVNIHNGRVWTYNSTTAFSELFVYFSKSQISRILKKLEDKDIIEKGNFNKNKFDKTNWYSFTDNGISMLQNNGYHLTKSLNGNDEIVKPIPDNKPYSKQEDNKENIKEKNWKEDFDYYLSLLQEAKQKLLVDEEFKEFMRKFYKNVDYNLTLEKSIEGYWGTIEAWEKRKKSRTKGINMYSTLKNAMKNRMNLVYKQEAPKNDMIITEYAEHVDF